MGSFICLGAGHLGPGLGRIFTQQKEKCQLFREMVVRRAKHLIGRSYGAATSSIDELLFCGAYVRMPLSNLGIYISAKIAVS
jgi:hypothetical protein